MVRGDLAVRDLPGAWNTAAASLVGIRPFARRRGLPARHPLRPGVSSGYFPTYALRQPYAASLFAAARPPDLLRLETQIGRRPARQAAARWLRRRSTAPGRTLRPRSWCAAPPAPASPMPTSSGT